MMLFITAHLLTALKGVWLKKNDEISAHERFAKQLEERDT